MDKIFSWLNKPQVHGAIALLSQFAAQFFPKWKPLLDFLSMASAYGATVTGLNQTVEGAPKK